MEWIQVRVLYNRLRWDKRFGVYLMDILTVNYYI